MRTHCLMIGASLALSLVAASLVLGDPKATLAAVCDKRAQSKSGQVVHLYEPQRVLELVATYKANPALCGPKYREAILNLEQVLSEEVLGDVCSLKTFEKLRNYHREHVHYFVPELNEYEIKQKRRLMRNNHVRAIRPIPEALRRFFIMYAKQINSVCRTAIPSQLERLGKELNLDAELRLVEQLRKEAKKSIRRALFTDTITRKRRSNLNLEELQLLDHASSRLYVNVPPQNPLWNLKEICSSRLRPLYNEVFTSVIKLNGLGYREQQYSERALEGALRADRTITRWYGIIQICELIKDIEVISRRDAPVGYIKEEELRDPSSAANSDSESDSDSEAEGEHEDEGAPQASSPGIRFRHGKVAYTRVLPVENEDVVEVEVNKFDRFIKLSVLERTSYFRLLRYDAKLFFGIVFNTSAARAADFRTGLMKWLVKHGLLTKRTAMEAIVFSVMLAALIGTLAVNG